MKAEELEKITKAIQEKLGNEASALINDDLATIILNNNNMNTELSDKVNIINTLKQDKENLILTNNKLFQQVAIGDEPYKEEKEKTEKKCFNFKSVFDEKGNFIE